MIKNLFGKLFGGGGNNAALAEGREYIAKKITEPGVYQFPSGLVVKILKKGTGVTSPLLSTPCTCHYEGSLINGKVFDSSYQRGQPIDFAPNQVIPGWTEALQMMREGDKWQVTLPHDIAYGPRGAGRDIPGYSTLNFDMELIRVKGRGKVASDEPFQKHFGKKYSDM